MHVREIMTADPTCCGPETSLQEVAKMMADEDCGCLPVVDKNMKPVGTITDRDITVRAVAKGRNPLDLTAEDCMTSQVISVSKDADLDECCRLLEDNQLRRLLVVDESGGCCGIVAQADIARKASEKVSGDLVKEVSKPTASASSA
ncbi:CBS domain-containing protein [soil metagenome]